ncbi:ADA2 (YDR448W) [Zygosaccharomyces parabailii]|uniref:Transcriptional adapter 2 n=1 Tax=Zygosaccharomyces bailii (strain CLIB 213 / ATCC 58445 / CBS 680 / BCRC 21525 / NBRC 1098 / NCYC 1416 / NRRL Y-2227) TaxID=1333698 RepID=A0A8J2X0J7_ZYGB2|nr:ADA2 (YDR448W) [Zygosaccharomyces parabailii]CDF89839.1 ZYBA0S05-02938g1_1 [Zygosaccharomyces bailii CLIB 213]CDH17598.1 probable Transcriptional adapter 2 [Zygosaccharomyces bailii ISA1307]SJM87107.1 probable Transcriptional adapter 2 [Zygosaccharomyces bailii]
MSNKFHCDVCSADCTNRVRISCAECPEYDLCVHCFSQGLYNGNHRPYHDYRIIETNSYPILCEDWGADEELALIKGGQSYGLGNWQDISDHIGSREKEEVAEHYLKYYIYSTYYPIPDITKNIKVPQEEFLDQRKKRIERFREKSLQPLGKPMASVPSCHEVQGFMPGRLEFEMEFENDAEGPVKDMVFEPDDQTLEIELKLTILDIYNSRLTTRAEKKRLLFDNNLMDYRRLQSIDKKRTKEAKELYNKIKAYAKIMTAQDFEEFSKDILEELRCRSRIAQLQEWRSNGLTTIEAGQKYERDKQLRLAALERFGTSNYMSSGMNSNGRHRTSSAHRTSADYSQNYSEAAGRKKNMTISDIQHGSDFNLLSPGEQQLCIQLKILPKPYLAIKDLMFRELLRSDGYFKKKNCRDLLDIEPIKANKIYDFFQSQNWV